MVANTPMQPTSGTMRSSTPSTIGISRRLSRGENAQDILDEVMDFIVRDSPADPMQAANCIILLSEHGARVATEDPGCAFENLICKPTRSRPGLILDVAQRLAGKPGEYPYHVLTRDMRMQLSDNMLDNPAIVASLHSRDSQGRTASHYLWDPHSTMVQDSKVAMATAGDPALHAQFRKDWISSVGQAWIVQTQLQALGVDMDIPDNQGVTALDLCLERLDAGHIMMVSNLDICNLILARRSSQSMGTDTPLVDTPPPPTALRF